MGQQVEITINGETHSLDVDVFRRVLTSAQGSLSTLKRHEGSSFPAVDRSALQAITDLQFHHSELI